MVHKVLYLNQWPLRNMADKVFGNGKMSVTHLFIKQAFTKSLPCARHSERNENPEDLIPNLKEGAMHETDEAGSKC